MRFYNSGKFIHNMGRDKETGEIKSRELDLEPKNHPKGTALISFPGSGFSAAVKAGEWVDLPYDISEEVAKSACPSLLTEAEYAKLNPAAPAKPAKG